MIAGESEVGDHAACFGRDHLSQNLVRPRFGQLFESSQRSALVVPIFAFVVSEIEEAGGAVGDGFIFLFQFGTHSAHDHGPGFITQFFEEFRKFIDPRIGASLDFVGRKITGLNDEETVVAVFLAVGAAPDDVAELLARAHFGVEGFTDEVR